MQFHRRIQLQSSRPHASRVVHSPCIDCLPEGRELFFLYLNTGRCRMSAEADQVLCTSGQSTVQIKRIRRTAAAAALPFMHGDHDHRAAVFFHQPSRHNADHPGVPALARNHEHPVPLPGRVRFQGPAGSSKNFQLCLLAFGVDFRQAGRNAGSLFLIAAQKQFQCDGCIVHTARRIQARRIGSKNFPDKRINYEEKLPISV